MSLPYNFDTDNIYTKKLCSRLSSNEVHFYTANGGFAFLGAYGKCTIFILGKLKSSQ